MANWEHCPAVERAPAEYGGHWVFRGTDVPLYAMYECLASGGMVDEFAERHNVDIEQAAAALRCEADELHDYRLDYPQGVPYMHITNRPPGGVKNESIATCPEVEQAAGRLGGAWVFKNTRLAVYVLYDNLASGCTLAEFDEWYEMDAARTTAVLEHAAQALRADAAPAYAYIA